MGTDPGAEGPRGRAGAHGVQAEPVAQRVVGCPRSPLHRLRDSSFTFSSIHLSIHRIHPSVIHRIHPPIIHLSIIHPTIRPPILPGASAVAGRAILSALPSLAVTPPPTARRPSALRGPSRSCPHTSGVTGVGLRQADFALSCRATQTCPVPGVRGRLSAGGRPLPPLPWAGGGRGIHTAPGTTALQSGVSQPRSRRLGLRGGALAWPRMSTARTAAAGGAPGWETGTPERPPPARASHWTRLPRSLACAPTREPSSVLNREWGGGSPPAPAARGTLARPAVYLLSTVHGTSQARGRMSEKVCKSDTRAHCALRSRRGSQLGVTGPPRSFATSGDIFVVVTDMRGGVVRI